jgi:hypothetical protein
LPAEALAKAGDALRFDFLNVFPMYAENQGEEGERERELIRILVLRLQNKAGLARHSCVSSEGWAKAKFSRAA